MRNIRIILLVLSGLILFHGMAPGAEPQKAETVKIGFDGEFGHITSTSAEAIKRGIEIAIGEINSAGGVLGGRKLELVIKDNRSVPARGVNNFKEFAADPDVVGVFTGKFSPVVQDIIPIAQSLGMIVLDPWAAADDIIDNGYRPSFIFRLSLADKWAMERMTSYCKQKKISRIGVILPNTGWGRSSLAAVKRLLLGSQDIFLAGVQWYNWGDTSLTAQYRDLLKQNVEVLIMVANETEGSMLVKEIAALPEKERLPILSHWGITGGQFVKLCGDALFKVDLQVVQTYSFIDAKRPAALRVIEELKKKYGVEGPRRIEAPVGVAHAYDLTHILARAINLAGSTDRGKVRSALETVKNYDGLIKNYKQPFTADRHEALGLEDVFLARYEKDGAIVPQTTK